MENDEIVLVDDRNNPDWELKKKCLAGEYTVEDLKKWNFSEDDIKYFFNKTENT